jgi:prepilin-type N-terminal cleavage/methylation domain-containing protein
MVMMGKKKQAAFTLTEILIVAAVMGVLGLMISKLFLSQSRSFNDNLWKQTIERNFDVSLQKIGKFFELASFPTLNTARGVIRDKRKNADGTGEYHFKIADSTLNEEQAYSKATRNLVRGKEGGGSLSYDTDAALWWFYGSGVKKEFDESDDEQEVLSWTSCRAGYNNIPGFADQYPRCGKHRLYLKNREKVKRANPDTYHYFQELWMDSSFSVTGNLTAGSTLDYIKGRGQYAASFSAAEASLNPDERFVNGSKKLLSNVATVAIKVYNKGGEAGKRSTTLEIDFIAVAPWRGNTTVKKSYAVNLTVPIDKGAGGAAGSGSSESGNLSYGE